MTTKFRVSKELLAGATLGLLGAIACGSTARADWHHDCRVRIERREAALDRAVKHWGAHSGRADNQRRLLLDTRDWCWNEHHAWWDGHAHIWMTTHW